MILIVRPCAIITNLTGAAWSLQSGRCYESKPRRCPKNCKQFWMSSRSRQRWQDVTSCDKMWQSLCSGGFRDPEHQVSRWVTSSGVVNLWFRNRYWLLARGSADEQSKTFPSLHRSLFTWLFHFERFLDIFKGQIHCCLRTCREGKQLWCFFLFERTCKETADWLFIAHRTCFSACKQRSQTFRSSCGFVLTTNMISYDC